MPQNYNAVISNNLIHNNFCAKAKLICDEIGWFVDRNVKIYELTIKIFNNGSMLIHDNITNNMYYFANNYFD